jgi:lipopolysaccharide transport system permease protein
MNGVAQDSPVEYIIEPKHRFSLHLRELWQYRELFYFFTWRDIKVKYKQTVLGFLWAVLQPLLLMSVFVLFFSKALRLSTDGIPAPVFYFSGLLLWNLFSSGLGDAANSMVANAEIIKKVYFPRLIIPLSSILVALFDFLMATIVFAGLLIYFKVTSHDLSVRPSMLIFFPAGLLLTLATTAGMGMLLSALNVKYRDFRYVIPYTIQFLLFLTPVIYPLSILHDAPVLKYALSLNPMTAAILLIRQPFTAAELDYWMIGLGVCSATILFLLGLYVFNRMEAYFADLA